MSHDKASRRCTAGAQERRTFVVQEKVVAQGQQGCAKRGRVGSKEGWCSRAVWQLFQRDQAVQEKLDRGTAIVQEKVVVPENAFVQERQGGR